MGALVGLILAVIVVIWGIAASTGQKAVGGWPEGAKSFAVHRPGRLAGAILLALFIYPVCKWSVLVIPGAHVACVYDPARGGIQNYTLPEGLNMIAPWVTTQQFSVQTQQYTMSIASKEGAVIGDDSIKCETNEGLKVLLDITVLFHIDPQHAPMLWRRLGENYLDIFVRPVTRERIRMVAAKYSVQEIYSGRRQQIATEITDELHESFAEEGLVLEQILLRNVAYGHQEFANAISEKQSRQQQVITEKRNLERAEYEKTATVNAARGEARSIALRANTLAANPEVVRYEMVQKMAPRIRKAYMPQSALPLPTGGER
jgi:regulator of protease activity HflC (stomatin/prohibitin superfamily)